MNLLRGLACVVLLVAAACQVEMHEQRQGELRLYVGKGSDPAAEVRRVLLAEVELPDVVSVMIGGHTMERVEGAREACQPNARSQRTGRR